MNPVSWGLGGVAVLVVLLLAVGWALYARAVRVDRLHRQVLGARATLETQMALRAQAVADLAGSGLLDPASSLLLSGAAHAALAARGPVVDDGLDPADRLDAQLPSSAGPAVTGAREAASGARLADPGEQAGVDTRERLGAAPRSRAQVESDLSRVVRAVVDEAARAELATTPAGQTALELLDRSAYRLALARRFHNTHVAAARALRSRRLVAWLHLAGRAPMPATCDMDDDIRPEAAGA